MYESSDEKYDVEIIWASGFSERKQVLKVHGAANLVRDLREQGRPVSEIFHHRGGRPVSPTALRKWWRAAATAAGHPRVIFHDRRRSAVRNMIRAGVSEPVAMSISGHQSAAIFRRYNITSVDDQRRALAAAQAYAAVRGRKDKRSSR